MIASTQLAAPLQTALRILLACVVGIVALIVPAFAQNTKDALGQKTLVVPTIFIAGDSTAANGSAGAIGWGKMLGAYFDAKQMKVVNKAIGGRSSRTFVSEGHWDRLMATVNAGDIVLIQFGHNDGGPIDRQPARGSLPGLGNESQEIDNLVTKQKETVHTFGWYMRKMIADTKAKGAMPIVLSLTVRNIWKDGKVERGSGRYGEWSRETAKTEKVLFVDLTKLGADRYEKMGEPAVKPLFPKDHTHTSDEGAKLNAELVVSGLKGLREQSIIRGLSAVGRTVPTATPANVATVPNRPPARGEESVPFQRWLNLPEPGDPKLPNLFLIGDSTVRTGRGDGSDGQFGWGDPFAEYFDRGKINVVNRAVGGTGARTFMTEGYWDRVVAMLKPGDVVIMQLGHNDNGARGALKGVGNETEERQTTGKPETVHTFGWYLRKYIANTRAKGATAIICSLIPRNSWRGDKIARTRDSHADWAKAVAEAEKAPFIDLHEIIALRYDALGKPAVAPLFADGSVHTSWAGAVLNAECVLSGLKGLPKNPVASYLLPPAKPD